jgi:hypothetical protein
LRRHRGIIHDAKLATAVDVTYLSLNDVSPSIVGSQDAMGAIDSGSLAAQRSSRNGSVCRCGMGRATVRGIVVATVVATALLSMLAISSSHTAAVSVADRHPSASAAALDGARVATMTTAASPTSPLSAPQVPISSSLERLVCIDAAKAASTLLQDTAASLRFVDTPIIRAARSGSDNPVQVIVVLCVDDPTECADAEATDAIEIFAHSGVAILSPSDLRRVPLHCGVTWPRDSRRYYAATFDVFEAAVYTVSAALRFRCGEQLISAVPPSHGHAAATATSTKPLTDDYLRLWREHKWKADLVRKFASPHCIVDNSLFGSTLTKDHDAVGTGLLKPHQWMKGGASTHVRVEVIVPGGAAAVRDKRPSCLSAPLVDDHDNIRRQRRRAGRWVYLRNLTRSGECEPPYCAGDAAHHLHMHTGDGTGGDGGKVQSLLGSRGWVYVPPRCYLHFPETAERAWRHFDGKTLVVLGDSTTSDTLFHFLRVVMRAATASPPRNRWSDPFEMVVSAPPLGAVAVNRDQPRPSFVLRQQRVGNMERDKASGWHDNLRGLEHFYAPFQVAKLQRWIEQGKSLVGAEAKLTATVKGATSTRKSDVEGISAKQGSKGKAQDLDGFADFILVHSGPHDRRRPDHTLDTYRQDVRRMKEVVLGLLPTNRTTGLLWRSNIVGAGPLYRCSRLENPWVYEAMDDAARDSLFDTAQRETTSGFAFLDAADACRAFHWTLDFSDGIHYGRYMPRYAKDTVVDRLAAVMWWNTMARWFESK